MPHSFSSCFSKLVLFSDQIEGLSLACLLNPVLKICFSVEPARRGDIPDNRPECAVFGCKSPPVHASPVELADQLICLSRRVGGRQISRIYDNVTRSSTEDPHSADGLTREAQDCSPPEYSC